MQKLAIIGVGNLGQRHLQSLMLCENDFDIYVIDRSLLMLDAAKVISQSFGSSRKIYFLRSVEELEECVDLAIVATTANERLMVFEFLANKKTRNIILEKVAFNSLLDIKRACEIFKSYKGCVWVNCPRRAYSFYQALKENTKNRKFNNIKVQGVGFGLACNAIHFLDLFSYFLNDNHYKVTHAEMIGIVESKRSGYIEFFGSVFGEFTSGCNFSLICSEDNTFPSFTIEAEFEGGMFMINELNGDLLLRVDNVESRQKIKIPYQSDLTGPIVDSILNDQTCVLSSFHGSMEIHYPFIELVYGYYSKIFGHNAKCLVPIT